MKNIQKDLKISKTLLFNRGDIMKNTQNQVNVAKPIPSGCL